MFCAEAGRGGAFVGDVGGVVGAGELVGVLGGSVCGWREGVGGLTRSRNQMKWMIGGIEVVELGKRE